VAEARPSTRLRAHRAPAPAAILLDIILEDEDGLELLAEVKRDPTTRDIP